VVALKRVTVILLLAASLWSAADTASHAAVGCGPAAHAGGDWPSYGHDLANTRSQPAEHTIGLVEAATLAPAWTFSTTAAGGAGDITATPVVANGCLYVGSNGGWVFALNADDGQVVWKRQVPLGGSVNGSAAIAGGKVIFPVSRTSRAAACTGPNCIGPYAVAFDQFTGAPAWTSAPLDSQPGADVYGSPVAFESVVLLGVSGGSAELGDEADRYAFQGSMVFLDLGSGQILRKTWTIHPPHQPEDDFAGGGIWSTASVDAATKTAFVGSANPFKPQDQHAHTNAVLKYDADRTSATFGQIVGSYKGDPDEYIPYASRLPCYDFPGNTAPSYPQGLGSCGDIDLDFGAAPNLFRDGNGRLRVGAGQKSGVYHVLDGSTMTGEWTSVVGPPTPVGGVVGSTAFDGLNVYGPVTVPGYLWSLEANRGGLRWASPTLDAVHWGNPVAVANGVVYTVDLKGFIDGYDAATGLPVLHRPMIVGANTTSPILSWGGVTVARNTVYAAVGIQGLPDGLVMAYRPGAAGGVPGIPGLPPVPALPGGTGGASMVIAGPGSFAATYYTPVAVLPRGSTLQFLNADIPLHDVISNDGLFGSPLIGLGQTTAVAGTEQLAPGQYGYFCSLHRNMTGTLIVQ
jgi:polyvinyl alcohol dehydrogenase (cytochrome)